MKYCRKCGMLLEDTHVNCIRCGADVTLEENVSMYPIEVMETIEEENKRKKATGKIVAMLTTPLNGIVISYLTNYKIEMNKKRFAAVGAACMGLTVIGAAACCFVSMIFVKWRYPNVYAEASNYFFLANLGQLLYFISGSLMVVLLAFTEEKLQFIINLVYGIAFVIIVIPATYMFGIVGIAYGLVAVNAVRFITVILLGVGKLGKNQIRHE